MTPLDVIIWALVGAACLIILTVVIALIVIAVRTLADMNADESTTIRKDPR